MRSLSSGWARAGSCAGDSASKQKLEVNCKDNFTLISFTLHPNSVQLIGLKRTKKAHLQWKRENYPSMESGSQHHGGFCQVKCFGLVSS